MSYPDSRTFNACFTLLVKATHQREMDALNVDPANPLEQCTSIFIDNRLVCVIHEWEGVMPHIVGIRDDHHMNTEERRAGLLAWYSAAGAAYTEYLED